MPGKTQESFVKGWFRTGDLGYQDPEDRGRLYLVGRAKVLIITGGYNVYPTEVETILESHEAVRESAAIGLPDEEFGEKVVAVVLLKEGKGSLLPEARVEHCKRRLAPYKCPRQIAIVAELPRWGRESPTDLAGEIRWSRLLESGSGGARLLLSC